jgi:uncharacterized protein
VLIERMRLLSPTIGTQREVVSLTYGPPDADMKVYVQASLHADETPAMLTAHALRDQLRLLESAGMCSASFSAVSI